MNFAFNNQNSVRFASILLMLLLLSGCKTPRAYHATDSIVPGPGTNFHTAFIEFDDQGELWEPQQIKNAVRAIRTNNPVLLVTYIHGWKNNAATNNDNYTHFTNMLHALAQKLPDQDKVQVFGVYMAWRGDSVAWNDPVSWAARQLSFWSRMEAAERVAGTSATEALYSILQAANSNPHSRVILMGHSMGALILEKALSQAMVSLMLSDNPNPKPPADLVLLINAAAPSIYARQFISMLARLDLENGRGATSSSGTNTHVFTADHPLVISATSKGDSATGKIFPLGMWFSSLTKSFRSYSTNDSFNGKQVAYYRTTTGHNGHLYSHKIVRLTDGPSSKGHSTLAAEQQSLKDNLISKSDPATFRVRGHSYEIRALDKAKNKTPYWVMQVPTEIIKNHDDIFNDRFTGFIGALLRYTHATDQSTPRRNLDKRQFAQTAQ